MLAISFGRSQSLRRGDFLEFRVNVGMMGLQCARDVDIFQQLADVAARQRKVQHVLAVALLHRFEFTFQPCHLLLHAGDVLRRKSFALLGRGRFGQLILGRAQDQRFGIRGRVVFGPDHQLGDFELPHLVHAAQ